MLETIKNISKDKKKEKLIYILVMCIILFIAFSYIFKEEPKEATSQNIPDINNSSNNLETEIENILSKIEGVSNVSALVTYENSGIIYPLYEENKEVVYNEENGNKNVVVEYTKSPTVSSIIIVADGLNVVKIKDEIVAAVSYLVNIPTYKVSTFERGE